MLMYIKKHPRRLHWLIILVLLAAYPIMPPAQAQAQPSAPVVQAVMFWMDGCPHCHIVLDNVLPPIFDKYGSQFELTLIEVVSTEDIDLLFSVAEYYGISKENVGVPLLVIADRALVGADAIPAELPGLIDQHLAQGGVNLPEIPALAEKFPAANAAADICAPSETCADPVEALQAQSSSQSNSPGSNGFGIAIVVLALMAGVTAGVLYLLYKTWIGKHPVLPDWAASKEIDLLVPLLSVIGLGIAGYLAYVETQAVQAVCGPVGDCNAVQSSPYAQLFGLLPVGVLGVAGYLAVLLMWVTARFGKAAWQNPSRLGIFALTFIGTIFSIYLTFLEPFVIQAVCMWCVSSAVIMTLLLVVSTPQAMEALSTTRKSGRAVPA
jgi:uncharacterized membrane protein